MNEVPQKHSPLSAHWLYLFVFLLAFGCRLLFLFFLDEPMSFTKYPYFAEKLAQGEDIGTRLVDLSPFYLYFFSFLKAVFSVDATTVKVLQSFFGAVNCVLLYLVGARIFSREVGLLSAIMAAVYGNLIVLETTLEPTVFVISFNLLTAYFLARAGEGGTHRVLLFPVAAGFCAGLAIISKPNFLLFLPLGAVYLAYTSRRGWRNPRSLVPGIVFVSVALSVVAPVTVRNAVRFHEFILVTADAGKVFFHGNGPGATALEGTGLPDEGFAEEGAEDPDYAHVLFRQTAKRLTGRDLTPSESSRFWSERTWKHIKNNLTDHVILVAKKLFYFFNDYEMHYIASSYNEYKASLAFPFLRYGVIASLAVLGMVLGVTRFRNFYLAYGMVAVYLLSCLLFLTQSRYRTPAVPYLCLFAGYGVMVCKAMITDKRWMAVFISVAALFLVFVVTSLVFRGEIEKVDRWQKATKQYYQRDAVTFFSRGQYAEAVRSLDTCIALIPDFSPALNLRGRALGALGMYDRAREDFKRVIVLSPQLSHGYESLGFLYILQGDIKAAAPLLQRALALDPGNRKVKKALMHISQGMVRSR